MKYIYRLYWLIYTFIYRFFFKRIGLFSYVAPAVYLSRTKNISIGNYVRVMPAARLESHGDGALTICDNVSIGNGVHIAVGSEIYISSGCVISSYVLITDIDHDLYQIGATPSEMPIITKPTKIGDNTFVGAGAKILAGTFLGKNCIVGANAVVRGSYPDYVVIAGVPARIIKKFNTTTNSWETVK